MVLAQWRRCSPCFYAKRVPCRRLAVPVRRLSFAGIARIGWSGRRRCYTFTPMTDYERIEKAIIYLRENFREQPDLDEVARQVYLSPFHFQRMFTAWAGVSPKKFLQYISVEHAKNLLSKNLSLLETSYETGLSGSSRLHDLFISIEGMTPGEYKNGGSEMLISYQFAQTVFGEVLVASTAKGICHLSFASDKATSLQQLFHAFPNASFRESVNTMQQQALAFFSGDWSDLSKVKLHLKEREAFQ